MPTPILATKLYIPPPRPSAVPRARLIERLDEGLRRSLTLVAAPAGFGKTTLLSERIAALSAQHVARSAQHLNVAWLSLIAAVFRLAMTTIHAINLLNLFLVLLLLSGAEYLAVFETAQLHALGALFLLAACGYLMDSAALLFVPGYGATPLFVTLPIAVAEIAFPLWLLVKGVDAEQWTKRVLASA